MTHATVRFRILQVILLAFITTGSSSQNTFVHSFFEHSNGGWGLFDYACGLRHAAASPDGTVYFLAKYHPHARNTLHKYDPGNQTVLWTEEVGSKSGGIWHEWCDYVRPTADSGCIIAKNLLAGVGGTVSTSIMKFSKGGSLDWSDTIYYLNEQIYTKDILQNSAGNYYILVNHILDTLLEYDAAGNFVSTLPIAASSGLRRFYELPGGDLILVGNGVNRWQLSGSMAWSTSAFNSKYCDITDDHVFLCDTSAIGPVAVVRKIDVSNGNVLWADTVYHQNISSMAATADGGAIVATGRPLDVNFTGPPPDTLTGHLVRLDSLGNTLWDKTYGIGEYGLSHVAEIFPGYYITGGNIQCRRLLVGFLQG